MSRLRQKTGLTRTFCAEVGQEAAPPSQSCLCHFTICVQESKGNVFPPAAEPGRPSASESELLNIDGAVPRSLLLAPGAVKVWLFSWKSMV